MITVLPVGIPSRKRREKKIQRKYMGVHSIIIMVQQSDDVIGVTEKMVEIFDVI